MSEIIIVGTGIAGSTLAKEFRSRGIETLVVSNGYGTSDAALAITRPSWVPSDDRKLFRPSMKRLEAEGVTVLKGAATTSYQRSGEAPRRDTDWRTIEPHSALIKPDIDAWAIELDDTTIAADGQFYTAETAVVWCDNGGDGKRTSGITWVHEDPSALIPALADGEPFDVRVHHLAPYHTLTGVAYETGARFGSSSSPDPAVAHAEAKKLFQTARDLGWLREELLDGWQMVGGERLDRPEHLVRTEEGAWRWGGFHRSGYAIAPAEAPSVASTILSWGLL